MGIYLFNIYTSEFKALPFCLAIIDSGLTLTQVLMESHTWQPSQISSPPPSAINSRPIMVQSAPRPIPDASAFQDHRLEKRRRSDIQPKGTTGIDTCIQVSANIMFQCHVLHLRQSRRRSLVYFRTPKANYIPIMRSWCSCLQIRSRRNFPPTAPFAVSFDYMRLLLL